MFIALVFLAHIYVDLIVSATNVLVVFVSTINKHFLLLLFLLELLYVSARTNFILIRQQVMKLKFVLGGACTLVSDIRKQYGSYRI